MITPPDPDWAAADRETLEHLRQLIRIDTSNPPGNELRTARYLEGVLRGAGIETEMVESAPGRAMLAARLRGDGTHAPLLLMAHQDVVGVQRDDWSVDPFAGVVRDGYLYGRGAIDDKGMLAVCLVTLLLVKRTVLDAGGTLPRDVVLLAAADEEAGGACGVDWLAEHRPDLLRAGYALNEGGRIRIVDGKPLYVAVQCAEKVPNVVRMTARGPGGHASVPRPDNCIVRLGRALAAVGAWREPLEMLPTTREFFRELSRVWPVAAEARAMADVASDDPERVARGAEVLARIPVYDAVLRNGISPTIIAGGSRANVIPAEATATLDVRTLPGQRLEDVLDRLRAAMADPAVELSVVSRGEDSPPSDFRTPFFAAIADAARALDPALAVVPYLSAGATDSAVLRRHGVTTYGVLPFPLGADDEARMHAVDERVPLASLAFGTRFMYGAVMRFLTTSAT